MGMFFNIGVASMVTTVSQVHVSTITKSSKKWTMRDLEALESFSMMNLPWMLEEAGLVKDVPRAQALMETYFLSGPKSICASSGIVAPLGPEHIRTRYEHSPGAWVYHHASGIDFVIFSDGWKKKPVRGTSIECVCSAKQLPLAVDALHDMLEHLVRLNPDLVRKNRSFCETHVDCSPS